MKRTALLSILLIHTFTTAAFSHTFEAIVRTGSIEEVILHDTVTGDEWVAAVGDVIDGYRIVEITPSYVTIAKPGEGRVVDVTKIPINGEHRSIKISP
jgi:hypothetical protein